MRPLQPRRNRTSTRMNNHIFPHPPRISMPRLSMAPFLYDRLSESALDSSRTPSAALLSRGSISKSVNDPEDLESVKAQEKIHRVPLPSGGEIKATIIDGDEASATGR